MEMLKNSSSQETLGQFQPQLVETMGMTIQFCSNKGAESL